MRVSEYIVKSTLLWLLGLDEGEVKELELEDNLGNVLGTLQLA